MSDLATLAEAGAVDPLVGHPPDYHVFHQFIERDGKEGRVPRSQDGPVSLNAVLSNGAFVARKESWS